MASPTVIKMMCTLQYPHLIYNKISPTLFVLSYKLNKLISFMYIICIQLLYVDFPSPAKKIQGLHFLIIFTVTV